MYLLKNALKNLGRNKGRNILADLITLAIILAVSVSIVINTTVDSVTKDYKSRFGAEVTLFLNTEIAKRHTNIQYPTAQQQMEIAKSDLLHATPSAMTNDKKLSSAKIAIPSSASPMNIAGAYRLCIMDKMRSSVALWPK